MSVIAENITSILPQLAKTHAVSAKLKSANAADKSLFLSDLSKRLSQNIDFILAENKKDTDLMELANPKYDRLVLTESRIQDLAESLTSIDLLPDPANQLLLKKTGLMCVPPFNLPLSNIY